MTADPVFVDRSGRRRRLIVAAGVAGGLTLLLAVGVLFAGLTGAGSAAAPGWPGAAASSPAPHRGVAAPKRSAVPRVTTNPPVAVRVSTAPPARTATPTATASPSPAATTTATPSATAKNRGRGPSIRASKRN